MFQLNQIRTHNFQLKLFDTAVTVERNRGHWKWHKWVKLNEYHHHAKFDTGHISNVWENHNIKVSATWGHSAGPPADHYIDWHFSCKSKSKKSLYHMWMFRLMFDRWMLTLVTVLICTLLQPTLSQNDQSTDPLPLPRTLLHACTRE